MKRIPIIIFFILVLWQQTCPARDFIVEFVSENYRETRQPFSYTPVVYHSIQVQSKAGSKIIILKGDSTYYRTWIRQFIAQGKQLIIHLPDDQDDLFIASSAFETDIKNIHPVNLALFENRPTASMTASLQKPADLQAVPEQKMAPENPPALQMKKRNRKLMPKTAQKNRDQAPAGSKAVP